MAALKFHEDDSFEAAEYTCHLIPINHYKRLRKSDYMYEAA